jgi:hypothetical protein
MAMAAAEIAVQDCRLGDVLFEAASVWVSLDEKDCGVEGEVQLTSEKCFESKVLCGVAERSACPHQIRTLRRTSCFALKRISGKDKI